MSPFPVIKANYCAVNWHFIHPPPFLLRVLSTCVIILPPILFSHLASVISALHLLLPVRGRPPTSPSPKRGAPPSFLTSGDKCKGALVNHHMVYKLNKRGLPASARRPGRASKLLTKLGGPQRQNFDDVINRGADKVPPQQKITGPPTCTSHPLPAQPQPEIPALAANYPPPMVRGGDRGGDAAEKKNKLYFDHVQCERALGLHVG